MEQLRELTEVCPVCGEKTKRWFGKEGLIPFRIVPRMCRCEREKYAVEQAERERIQRIQKINRLREKGLSDAQYRDCTFALDDGADKHASNFCRRYVEEWPWMQENNAGILLWGDVGGGKTFYAACIANALIEQGIPAVMTTIPQLTARMQKSFGAEREQVLSMVKGAPLLVLDDVGTERNTEYGNELVYEIINQRYKAKKPLIVTTNLTMETLRSATDTGKKRVYDRIIEMCAPCQVATLNRRKQVAQDKFRRVRERIEGK